MDSDRDGLLDGDELFIYFTNPNDPDSDGDGFEDGFDVQQNTDPNSTPMPQVSTMQPFGLVALLVLVMLVATRQPSGMAPRAPNTRPGR